LQFYYHIVTCKYHCKNTFSLKARSNSDDTERVIHFTFNVSISTRDKVSDRDPNVNGE